MNMMRCRKGVAAVEFALLLPVLVVLAFGIIEFGLLMYNQQVITNASREGARAGIVQQDPRVDAGQIISIVNSYCASHLVTFGAGTVPDPTVPSGKCTAFGADLAVHVSYVYTFLVFSKVAGLLGSSTPGTISLTAQTVMRCE